MADRGDQRMPFLVSESRRVRHVEGTSFAVHAGHEFAWVFLEQCDGVIGKGKPLLIRSSFNWIGLRIWECFCAVVSSVSRIRRYFVPSRERLAMREEMEFRRANTDEMLGGKEAHRHGSWHRFSPTLRPSVSIDQPHSLQSFESPNDE